MIEALASGKSAIVSSEMIVDQFLALINLITQRRTLGK